MSRHEDRFASQPGRERFENRFNQTTSRPGAAGNAQTQDYHNNRNYDRTKPAVTNSRFQNNDTANKKEENVDTVKVKSEDKDAEVTKASGDTNSSAVEVKTENSATENSRKTNDRSAPHKSSSSSNVGPPNQSADGKKKFTGRCRLFFGNIPISLTEDEFIKLIKPYGDTEDLFLNAKKGFGFVKLETRAAAEACKNGLDGIELQGRSLRVRYATHSAALQVKNLSVHCTNEALEQAFSLFGDVERAVVVVDDRGKSQSTGIVEFSRRAAFNKALEAVTKGVFLISKSTRPVCVEPLDQKDEEDGLPEKYANRNQEWMDEMSVGPRLAEQGSYEYDIGMKWKELDKLEVDKKMGLEEEMAQKRMEMELDVEALIHEHKANMLRQEMMRRQAELNALEAQRRQREELKLKELEMRRMQMSAAMGASRNLGNQGSRMGGQAQMGGGSGGGMGGSSQMMTSRGASSYASGGQGGGGGFSGTEKELLMHQQQALRERQQQVFREMQLKQQQGLGGQQPNRPMQPPPQPPQYHTMPESGRGSGGGSGLMGQGGGGRMGSGLLSDPGSVNQGRGSKEGMSGRSSRFDQPPAGMTGGSQGMQGGSQGMQQQQRNTAAMASRSQQNMQQQQQQLIHQQQSRMFSQGGMGPGDAKRPRRF